MFFSLGFLEDMDLRASKEGQPQVPMEWLAQENLTFLSALERAPVGEA